MSTTWTLAGYTPSYAAGVAGTATLPNGACVVAIIAHATAAASVSIFGGPSIPIPAGTTWNLDVKHLLLQSQPGAATVVFTGTDSYSVFYLRANNL